MHPNVFLLCNATFLKMSNGSINGHANGNGPANVSAVPPIRSYEEDRNTKSQDV